MREASLGGFVASPINTVRFHLYADEFAPIFLYFQHPGGVINDLICGAQRSNV